MTQTDNLLNISGLKQESLMDGIGMRTVIFFQGCSHDCLECQNPHTQDFSKGTLVNTSYLINYIKEDKLSTGVTYSGGCPLCQYKYFDILIELSKQIKQMNLSIWCYCGENYEELTGKQLELLKYIDVLIDGKYDLNKRDDTLPFRGSSNQRIINVKESLTQGKLIKLLI